MTRIIGCITDQHDIPLLLLAVAVCAFGSYTAVSLLGRVRADGAGGIDWRWLFPAAVVAGASVWTTHFVAMLAYEPGVPLGYGIGLTGLSFAIAIVMTAIGFLVALGYRAPVMGGAIFGASISAMHFTGMEALSAPAILSWHLDYVLASIAIGIAGGALFMRAFVRARGWRQQAIGTTLMVLAIAGMHFTAMSALTMRLNPTVMAPDASQVPPSWLAVAVAAVMAIVIILGLVASVVDHHLAGRAAQEAERLRRYVAELEQTKRDLQATTQNLTRALDAAAIANQAKSQFLATMSHELRTPLNAIIGFSELIHAEAFGPLGDARYGEYVGDVLNSGKHLLALVNDVLDFSKIDAGALELSEDHIDVPRILASSLRMVEGQAAKAEVSLEQEFAHELPILRADERRVRQILLNLLSNAVKFTPRGGRVRLLAYAGNDELVLQIADTGIGIAPDDIPRALERFGQVDDTLGRKYEGTGLGLPLTKRLVELHGGRLELESQLGIGTRVTAIFPGDRLAGGFAIA